MPELPNRKSNRLRGYDYRTANYYFVTICTHKKRCIFGPAHRLSAAGEIARDMLLAVPEHFPDVQIDHYVVMPNHIHAIVVIGCADKAERACPFPTLSSVVGSYKSAVSRAVRRQNGDITVWQKSFYDHIIRNERSYLDIHQYISENPAKWQDDEFYVP